MRLSLQDPEFLQMTLPCVHLMFEKEMFDIFANIVLI